MLEKAIRARGFHVIYTNGLSRDLCKKNVNILTKFLTKISQVLDITLKKIVSQIINFSPASAASKKLYSYMFKRELFKIERRYQDLNIFAIYAYADRHEEAELPLIYWANTKGIKVIIPPIAFNAQIEATVNAPHRVNNPQHDVTDKHEFKRKFPKQWERSRLHSRDISFYPYKRVALLADAGTLPENPWVIGGGGSTFLCVDGNDAYHRSVTDGVDKEKIVITGNAEHDVLHDVHKRWRSFTEQNKNRQLGKFHIVFAVPQYFEHGYCSESEQINLLKGVLAALLNFENIQLTLSLHPKMLKKNYLWMEANKNFRVSEQPLREILPKADLFIAGEGSATILWAVLLGVPHIALYFYNWSNSGVRRIENLCRVDTVSTLQEMLELHINHISFSDKQIRAQQRFRSNLSPFDGRCIDRILNLGLTDVPK